MYQEREIGKKCANCGFLAVRNRYTRSLDEAERRFRDTGEPAKVLRTRPYNPAIVPVPRSASLDQQHEIYPVCFAQKTLFEAEIWERACSKSNQNTAENEGKVWNVTPHDIRDYLRSFTCNEWVRWSQGSTPKEHREMMDRERMLKWQRDQSNLNWFFRILELGVVILGVFFTVWYVVQAAQIEADAQRDAARMQIEAMERLATPSALETSGPQNR